MKDFVLREWQHNDAENISIAANNPNIAQNLRNTFPDGCDWVISTFVTMTADESSEYASIMNNIDTYVNETLVKFIMGIRPLEEFDTYVEDIWAMGLQDAIDIQQAALNRYNAR